MDPYHHHQHQQPPHPYNRPPQPPPPPPGAAMSSDPRAPFHGQPPPPPPPPGSFYPGDQFQFQYYHPSPPLPGHHQWGPPPQQPYGPPPPQHTYPPYPHPHPVPPPPPPQQQQQTQFPQPRPPPPMHPPPPYNPNSQASAQPPQLHQGWGNEAGHSSWEYPAGRDEEDWASRARAWAASRAATEGQHQQPQFGTVGRLEEPSHYLGQYPSVAESQYQDIQQQSGPVSGYHNYPVQGAEMSKQPLAYPHEIASISTGQPSYAADQYYSYPAQDGNVSTEAGSSFPSQQQLASSSFHQQEVPSSYPSVPGGEGAAQGQHRFQRSALTEPALYAHTNQSADPMTDPRDQPLEFTPRFTFDNKPKMPPMYEESQGRERGKDSIGALPPVNTWTSSAGPGASFPSLPPTFPSTTQLGSPLGLPPHPIQAPQIFGPSPSFPAAIPSIAAAGPAAAAILPGDAYGAPIGSDRPKKAAVPNWLREEIIKKASVVGSSSNHLVEETQSVEDEAIDKSVGKGGQADSKSIDSSRLTEEEDDDDEDYLEAARTAAINQEIKRILTDVLLKVTDELLDDIATRVLTEDDIPVDGNHDTHAPNHKLSSPPTFPAPKASAKVLIPVKARESEAEDASEQSDSGAAGNVLGLASYASDDEEEAENHSSNRPVSSSSTLHIATRKDELPENGANNNTSSTRVSDNHDSNLGHNEMLANEDNADAHPLEVAALTRKDDVCLDGRTVNDMFDASNTETDTCNIDGGKSEFESETDDIRKSTGEYSRLKDSQSDRHESKKSLLSGDSSKDTRSSKVKEEHKSTDTNVRRDEKHQKKDKTEDKHGLKERSKEEVRDDKRKREADSGKGGTEGRKEREIVEKMSDRYDVDRKNQQKQDELADRSKDKVGVEVSKDRRRPSPSVGRRNGQDRSNARSHGDSSDEASDESRRKKHSKRKNLSPSPSRSRKRQISQSPKRSQRRHSPYSSLETSRGRRSRSRSPIRRKR